MEQAADNVRTSYNVLQIQRCSNLPDLFVILAALIGIVQRSHDALLQFQRDEHCEVICLPISEIRPSRLWCLQIKEKKKNNGLLVLASARGYLGDVRFLIHLHAIFSYEHIFQ